MAGNGVIELPGTGAIVPGPGVDRSAVGKVVVSAEVHPETIETINKPIVRRQVIRGRLKG